MTLSALIRRSLQFHARSHLGALLGAAVGSAALIGALAVGDSVRFSLRQMALARLGPVHSALASNDRFFRDELARDLALEFPGASESAPGFAPLIQLPGTAARADGAARANQIQILGVDPQFLSIQPGFPRFESASAEQVVLSDTLAAQLNAQPGDTVLLRMHKPSLLSREAPISPQADFSLALRLEVRAVAAPDQLGRFNLHASASPTLNAFVPLDLLQAKLDLHGRANLLLAAPPASETARESTLAIEALQQALENRWQLADAELELRRLTNSGIAELRSRRVYLESAILDAAQSSLAGSTQSADLQPLLTYFVNHLDLNGRSTPYSMVTAAGPPFTPARLADDEIILGSWLADDLQAQPGDTLTLRYFIVGEGQRLAERQSPFRVHSIAPLAPPHADPELMPDFPGIAQAEKTENWDAGFPIQMSLIRPKDEQYWTDRRGTPKAYVSLEAGQRMWANRFGNLTAIRFPDHTTPESLASLAAALRERLDPDLFNLRFQPVRQLALAGAAQSQDFGELFLGFSFFLILAALILMGLLFQFGLEQRLGELGTLLAIGFTPARVRRLLLLEGAAIALAGGGLGAVGGLLYARAMLLGLTTVWSEAIGGSSLQFHATGATLAIGTLSATLVGILTLLLVLRKHARQPARVLLDEGTIPESVPAAAARAPRSGWIALALAVPALALMAWAAQSQQAQAPAFFGAGALLLGAGLALASYLLALPAAARASQRLSLLALGLRALTRRRKRSLASIALLACGSFLIAAVGANKLDANLHADQRSSGTGGFAFLGQSTLPVLHDLNQADGRDFFGLDPADLEGVAVVPLRVNPGDEASCLNLSRAQQPRLLGVNPDLLDSRQAFTFAQTAPDLHTDHPWLLLRAGASNEPEDPIPAIGDHNSILWALGKQVGDTLDFVDERGEPFRIRLVGGVANSILQGNLLLDEKAFLKRFPGQSGYRMFLIDAPSNSASNIAAALSRALQDVGLELTPAARRLAEFNAVQNTYLNTFQILGGLGLLLGTAGLGVVVLRNVLERRGELALLQAVGFKKRSLQWLVLAEHGGLLVAGLALGLAAALTAILPSLLQAGPDSPLTPLALTLAGVLISGLLWTWIATRWALRGSLLSALRNE